MFMNPIKDCPLPGTAELQKQDLTSLCYIDDDAEATTGFLESIVQFMNADNTIAGIGGKVIPKYSESEEPKWMSKYLNGFVGLMDYGSKPKRFDNDHEIPGRL